MYVLYTDESGELSNPDDRVLIVAGIAVHEEAVRPLAGEVNRILRQYVGQARASRMEIHGSALRTGRSQWRSVNIAKRHALAAALLDTVVTWKHEKSSSQVLPFVVVLDRAPAQAPIETAYGELLFAFDETLRRKRRDGDGHNCVLVADRGKYERAIAAWVELARAWKRTPRQERRRLHALVETPFFVDSRDTRLMQLADLVSFSFFRSYNFGDATWANRVMPAMKPRRGRILHLAAAGDCSCSACAAAQASRARERRTARSRPRRRTRTSRTR